MTEGGVLVCFQKKIGFAGTISNGTAGLFPRDRGEKNAVCKYMRMEQVSRVVLDLWWVAQDLWRKGDCDRFEADNTTSGLERWTGRIGWYSNDTSPARSD